MVIAPQSRIARARFRLRYAASAVIVWAARLWQAFWQLFPLAALFAVLAMSGAIAALSFWLHWLALAGFAATALWLLSRGLTVFRAPNRATIEHAMEQAAGVPHRPLAALRDTAVNAAGADTQALWAQHQAQMQSALSRVRRARFETDVPAQDPRGLRWFSLAIVIAALLLTGRDAAPRLRDALAPGWPQMAGVTAPALDIWIAPPDYTQAAPVYLRRTQNTSAKLTQNPSVPAGSIVKLRLSGYAAPPVIFYGGRRVMPAAAGGRNYTAEFKVTADGLLSLRQGLRRLGRWPVQVLQDMPPALTLEQPVAGARDALKLLWRLSDDYGVTQLRAVITPPPELAARVTANNLTVDLPAPPPPSPGMALDGAFTYLADLTGNPLAGQKVQMQLVATDALGQEGRSNIVEVTLPERQFRNPVAQRLIVERKRLLNYIAFPMTRLFASNTLLSIVNNPPLYRGDPIVFLTLASAAKRLGYDRTDAGVDSVRDLLWDIALRVEDGGVSESARDVQSALERLSATLNDPKAAKQDIQQRLAEVQEALQKYMQSLAQEMQQRQMEPGTQMPPQLAEKVMKKIDIDQLMQRLREMSEGDARQQMQKMAEMLRNAVANTDVNALAEQQRRQQQAMQALSQMEDIIRRQQELIDRTARASGDAAENRENAAEQRDLQNKLAAIKQTITGFLPGAGRNLDTAGSSMGSAADQLSQGQNPGALAAEKDALKMLMQAQDAAVQQLAEAMQQMMMLGMGGESGGYGRGFDPLGRGMNNGDGKSIGGRIGLPNEAERRRVQEIQNELRDRYNDSSRPRGERDYIERLLDLFK